MILSHRNRFVTLLPWKSASQTLRLRLADYDESPYSRFYHFNPYLNRVVHQHLTCADFMALPEGKLDYLVAVFVRNPYDRVWSAFRQVRHDIAVQPEGRFASAWVRTLVHEQLAANAAQLRAAGDDFDTWVTLLRDEQVFEAGRNTSLPLHPAHYWTHVAGRTVAGFIGRVETFEADFRRFRALAAVGEVPLVNDNVTELVSEPAGYPSGYRYAARMSARSRARITELFQDDFDIFGYETVRG